MKTQMQMLRQQQNLAGGWGSVPKGWVNYR